MNSGVPGPRGVKDGEWAGAGGWGVGGLVGWGGLLLVITAAVTVAGVGLTHDGLPDGRGETEVTNLDATLAESHSTRAWGEAEGGRVRGGGGCA